MPIISSLGGISSMAMGRTGGFTPAIFTIGATTFNLGGGDVYNFTDQTLRTATMQNTGSMRVKMWGGGGGGGQYSSGGGGNSSGIITFETGTQFTIRTGGGGNRNGGTPGGGNGGGESNRGGGGGYSGIFINSVAFANTVMLAGGGGGSGNGAQTPFNVFPGGAGGGTNGQGGTATKTGGGSQSAGGVGNSAGSQLQGGSGLVGGGAGYYGGGAGGDEGTYAPAGGGGSGYINTTYVLEGSTETGDRGDPANKDDTDRNGAGSGVATTNTAGEDGRILIYWS